MVSPELQPIQPLSAPADEAALLERVALGDRDAFRTLYYVYYRRLQRFLLRLTRERETSEEIINDTMLVVWQHAAEFRGEARASTWIFGIAYRRALKTLEKQRGHVRRLLAATQAVDANVIDALAQSAELDDWLDAALNRLSNEHRLVIELAYVLGLSCEEIADATTCPVGTVKTRMFYARERLRESLLTLADPQKPGARVGSL